MTPNSPDFWYSTDYIKDISVSVETIAEAREKYAEIIWNDYSIEISKTNQKRPKKMFMDTPNGQRQVGFVFTGMTDIDFGNIWKKDMCLYGQKYMNK